MVEFICPLCKHVIKIKHTLKGDLMIEAVVLLGVCRFCKSRVKTIVYADAEHKQAVECEVELLSDGNYIG